MNSQASLTPDQQSNEADINTLSWSPYLIGVDIAKFTPVAQEVDATNEEKSSVLLATETREQQETNLESPTAPKAPFIPQIVLSESIPIALSAADGSISTEESQDTNVATILQPEVSAADGSISIEENQDTNVARAIPQREVKTLPISKAIPEAEVSEPQGWSTSQHLDATSVEPNEQLIPPQIVEFNSVSSNDKSLDILEASHIPSGQGTLSKRVEPPVPSDSDTSISLESQISTQILPEEQEPSLAVERNEIVNQDKHVEPTITTPPETVDQSVTVVSLASIDTIDTIVNGESVAKVEIQAPNHKNPVNQVEVSENVKIDEDEKVVDGFLANDRLTSGLKAITATEVETLIEGILGKDNASMEGLSSQEMSFTDEPTEIDRESSIDRNPGDPKLKYVEDNEIETLGSPFTEPTSELALPDSPLTVEVINEVQLKNTVTLDVSSETPVETIVEPKLNVDVIPTSTMAAEKEVSINGEAFEKLEENSVEISVADIAKFTGNKELGLHSLQKKGLVSASEEVGFSSSQNLQASPSAKASQGSPDETLETEESNDLLNLSAFQTSTKLSSDREVIINGEAVEKLEESSIEVPLDEIAKFTGNKELGIHSLQKKGIVVDP